MKSILSLILGTFLLGFISNESLGQGQETKITRNYNFEVGDILSSSTGTITGELRKAESGDDEIVGVFMGLNSNLRSDVVRSEGVVEVNVPSKDGNIKRGDLLAVVGDGHAGKMNGDGMSIGIALSEPVNGKVKVRLDIAFIASK